MTKSSEHLLEMDKNQNDIFQFEPAIRIMTAEAVCGNNLLFKIIKSNVAMVNSSTRNQMFIKEMVRIKASIVFNCYARQTSVSEST